MSATMLLYSSHQITGEELAEVLRQAGGRLTPASAAGYFGGIDDGRTYIWVNFIPCYDGVFYHEGNPLDENDMVLLEQAKALLGGEFQTWIHITLDRTPTLTRSGSLRLAIRFAHACCQRWPCILDNNEGRLFSCDEIEELYKGGDAITGYGL